jgi:hypothetical protein
MRKMIFAAVALAALAPTLPASAQVFFSDDPAARGGFDGAAVPAYGGRRVRDDRDFGSNTICREVREQVVTPSGHVANKLHRSCY